MQIRTLAAALALAATLLTAGCASNRAPPTRVDYDNKADFSVYRTYGFPKETGTDRGGYSTLVTSYFKSSVATAMEARGYKYSAENPDLLVNFFMNTRDRTEVRPNVGVGYGYYGYRDGLYGGWPMYDRGPHRQLSGRHDQRRHRRRGEETADLGGRLGGSRDRGSAGESEGDGQRGRHRVDAQVSGQAEYVTDATARSSSPRRRGSMLSSASISSAVSSISTVVVAAAAASSALRGSGRQRSTRRCRSISSSTSGRAAREFQSNARMAGQLRFEHADMLPEPRDARSATQFTAAA